MEYGKKLVELQPLRHEGYELLGKINDELMQFDKAREWLEKASERVTPEFRQFIMYRLYKVYEALGMVDEAKASLEEYMRLSDQRSLSDMHSKDLERLAALQSKMKGDEVKSSQSE